MVELQRLANALRERAAAPVVAIATVSAGDLQTVAASAEGAADPDVRLRIASVTKPIVAALIAHLSATGGVSLDDPVRTHLPGRTWAARLDRRITLRRLLQHTSGLQPDVPELGRHGEGEHALEAAVVDVLCHHRRRFAPGRAWEYANSGYWLAGLVVAERAGSALEETVHACVLEPLEMGATGFDRRNDADSSYPRAGNPAAGLLSTVGDLARFAHVFFAGSPALNGVSAAAVADGAVWSSWGTGYGLGWQVERRAGVLVLAHDGALGEEQSRLVVVPERCFAVAAITVGAGVLLPEATDLLLQQRCGLRGPARLGRSVVSRLAATRFSAAHNLERARRRAMRPS